MTRFSIPRVSAAVLAAAICAGQAGAGLAADIPAATKKMLAELKFDASVLAGLDDELKVPDAWVAAAKKEGKVRYLGTFGLSEWPKFIEPFRARYPFIEIEHQRGSRMGRVDKPLIAFKEGRVVGDLIAAIGGRLKGYKDAGALMDLRDLPNFDRTEPNMRAKDGSWVGEKVKYWCMAYNTTLVKKADLPKTWDGFLTAKALHNNNLGITNRPHNWILPLWTAKGAKWGRRYIADFFNSVHPQLRKEGARAVVTLTIAGEFKAALPATDYRVNGYAKKGAPIAWHCPAPVPVTISELVIIKGTKVPYSAKLFVNWFLSREGQIAQYYATEGAPVHKGLQDHGFSPYPEEVKGKPTALRTADSLVSEFTVALKAWNAGWKAAGGQVDDPSAAKKLATTLVKVESGGRRLAIKAGGGEHKVKISRSRTQILVGGKPATRAKLKVGMKCDVTYSGDGSEAKIVACR